MPTWFLLPCWHFELFWDPLSPRHLQQCGRAQDCFRMQQCTSFLLIYFLSFCVLNFVLFCFGLGWVLPQCTAGSYCSSTGLTQPEGECSPGYYCAFGAETSTPTDNISGGLCGKGHVSLRFETFFLLLCLLTVLFNIWCTGLYWRRYFSLSRRQCRWLRLSVIHAVFQRLRCP